MLLAIIKILHNLGTTDNNAKFDNLSYSLQLLESVLLIFVLKILLCCGRSIFDCQ